MSSTTSDQFGYTSPLIFGFNGDDDSPEEISTIGLGDFSDDDFLEAPSEAIFEEDFFKIGENNESKKRRRNSNSTQLSSSFSANVPGMIPEIMLLKDRWSERFTELEAFKSLTGHCNVPYSFKQNPVLARWVKRQRYQYKLMLSGKSSTMTFERARTLESIGFVFRYHATAWDQRFNELRKFHAIYGHCDVPRIYSPSPQLYSWTKAQRRVYRAFSKGRRKKSFGTTFSSRFHSLNQLGFKWELTNK